MTPIAGELVSETFDYDGGRQVTAYVPPAPPEAIVFAGDGQLIALVGRRPRGSRPAADDDHRCPPRRRRDPPDT